MTGITKTYEETWKQQENKNMPKYTCCVCVAIMYVSWTLWDADSNEIRSTESLGQDKTYDRWKEEEAGPGRWAKLRSPCGFDQVSNKLNSCYRAKIACLRRPVLDRNGQALVPLPSSVIGGCPKNTQPWLKSGAESWRRNSRKWSNCTPLAAE